jgi:hypothetical protein
MAANRITVSLLVVPSGFVVPSRSMDIPLGQFPAGTYQVDVTKRSPSGASLGSLGSVTFSVAARSQSDPLWNNSDIWWNPSESGWGLTVVQHASGIFANWLVYGPDNKPIWYSMPGGQWTAPDQFRGMIYRTMGPYFGGPFDPSSVTVTLVGSAILDFDPNNYNVAAWTYTVDAITAVKLLRRMEF